MNPWDQFTGANAGYVSSCSSATSAIPRRWTRRRARAFATWTPADRRDAGQATGAAPARRRDRQQAAIAAFTLAESIRRFGHLAARSTRSASTTRSAIRRCTRSARPDHRRAQGAAGVARRRPGGGRRGQRLRGHRAAARRSTARPPASTSRTSSCPKSASGCAQAVEVAAVPAADRSDRRPRAARPHHAGRGLRALPAPHVPGQDALLDRRPRHAGADPRRDHLRRGRQRRAAT